MLRYFVLCVLLAPLLMAPSGGAPGCVGFYSYNECAQGQTQACYSGAQGCQKQGDGTFRCTSPCKAGSQSCKDDGTWGPCQGEVLPKSEGECKAPASSALATGTFVGASGHTTVGSVEVLKEGDKEIVVLKADFKTDSGPDLHVYLVDHDKGDIEGNAYIDLAKIASFSGTSRYEIPAGKSIASFKSVVIWCVPFKVNFGYATLVKN